MRERRDTAAWIFQSWAMFGIAVVANTVGVYNMNLDQTTTLLLATLALFTTSAAFTLSKTLRDNKDREVDTKQWIFQVWAGFLLALSLSVYALWNITLPTQTKWMAGLGLLLLIQSVFVLAKTIRDNLPPRENEQEH
jgi:hypothetical protein